MQGGSVSVASPRPARTPAESLERVGEGGEREIDLVAVALLLWARRWWLALAVAIGTAAALYVALTSRPTWRAEVVMTEVHEEPMGGGAASFANQLGGLVNLTGLGIGANRDEQDYQAVLESRRLLEEFITRNDLLPQLSADPRKRPTLWRAVRDFQKNSLYIKQDPRRGITTLSVEWTDPVTAAHWANGLVELANDLIRTRALTEAQRNVTYLSAQAERTTDVDLRRVIYGLIENQTKTVMLANGRPEYAFRVVDPAVPPEIRASPHRTLLVIAGFFSGAVLGALLILAWDWVSRQRARWRP